MIPTNGEIADALARAAGIIEERGWCQGAYVAEDGRVCLMGAVARAVGVPDESALSNPVVWECNRALEQVIARADIGEWENPEDWNDWPNRDAREVVDLLEGLAWQYQIKAESELVPVG